MNNTKISKLQEILEGREKRAHLQKKLLETYNIPLASFTLNIPGPEKNSPILKKIHHIGASILEEELRKRSIPLIYSETNESAAGPEQFFCIDWDATSIKRLTVSIEEKDDLGRLFDFDVFNENGSQISRQLLGLQGRKCLLCHEKPAICSRNKSHSLEELLKAVYNTIKDYESKK
ncbi:holo-ACP synthase [Anaerovirgula multivorans]|uniref:citrate lyase holo-[acyl-carrier protein] synthase n=1 Tax=Anaerovirgula multivorans TaxID=312168 RepID=A0A239FQP0_9FIRM|nr:citrate lyase holo-[acyl-carrier protein] synthase [Anaerovirgula multivorans]SNS59386.1 holo-ACP synthase [Anaerovirgula multivorans]